MWGQGARCWEVNAKPGGWETLRSALPESSMKREKHTTGLPDEALASDNSCPQWKRDKQELRGGRSCFNQNNLGERTTVQKLGEGTWGCLGYVVCLFEIHHEFNRAGSKSWEQRTFRVRKAGLKHESIVEIPCSRITELFKPFGFSHSFSLVPLTGNEGGDGGRKVYTQGQRNRILCGHPRYDNHRFLCLSSTGM